MKLLIVEDHPQMRRLIRSLVAKLAEDIYECSDGTNVLSLYAQHLPDWVLMDVELPNLDGITATRQLRAAFPEARVVIVTQYDDVGFRRAAREAGACEYILKENLLEVRCLLESST